MSTKPGELQCVAFLYEDDDWNWNPVYTKYDQKYVEDFYRFVEPGTGRRYRRGDLTAAKAWWRDVLRVESQAPGW